MATGGPCAVEPASLRSIVLPPLYRAPSTPSCSLPFSDLSHIPALPPWHRDLNDLWSLELLPTNAGSAASGAGANRRTAAPCTRDEAFNVEVFKARQARACAVIRATPTADNKNGISLHDLVRMAACADEATEPHDPRAHRPLSRR